MSESVFFYTTDYKSIVLHAHSLRSCIQSMTIEEREVLSRATSLREKDLDDLRHLLSLLCKKHSSYIEGKSVL